MACLAAVACLNAGVAAQVPFAIPPGPEVLAVPLLLLIAGIAAQISHRDAQLTRDLEKRADWPALAQLAARRLARLPAVTQDAIPGSPPAPARARSAAHWYAVRALALQRQGDFAAALADYDAAAVANGAPLPSADLNRGLCLMALRQWAAAQQAMQALAAREPGLWEPWYNLSVIGLITSDIEGARQAMAELRARRPAMAAALARDPPATGVPVGQAPSQDVPAALAQLPVTGPDLAVAHGPALLDGQRLSIGPRALVLPPGRWILRSVDESTVAGRIDTAPSHRAAALAPALGTLAIRLDDGALTGAVFFQANRPIRLGIRTWSVDPCPPDGALLVERFTGRFDQPRCLSLHRTAPADADPQGTLGAALSFARALGARPLEGSYFGFHHEQFGPDQFSRVTVLLPARMLAGELMAAAWAHTLASALRPLTEGREGSATIPRAGLLPEP